MNLLLFYVLAAVILISGVLVVTLRNVFHSALLLVLTFFTVAGIYLTLGAELLAAVQVLIYVGAITILILFAVMLTYQIQSKSIRQVNEQVVPAILISALFSVLAIFALTKTFGNVGHAPRDAGSWTAAVDVAKLPATESRWYWTATLEDSSGKNYIAAGNVMVIAQDAAAMLTSEPASEPNGANGYILSANSDFSAKNSIFGTKQTMYLKLWSETVDYASVTQAVWKLTGQDDKTQEVTSNLSNSNAEHIGRLMMSKFVLPFEIVSVLLLVSLIGAVVIARKDK